MELIQLTPFIANIVFVMALGWYLITNLQWYDYRIERVVLRHHKTWWHVAYFIVPFVLYYALGQYGVFLVAVYIPLLYLWHLRLDKKVVLTWRVKRFLIVLFTLAFFINFLFVVYS